ncbi:MAG: ribonucleotide-diphosphate reductase subunit beta, partial [Mucispirillum sp.]|nr:ribonucleotide-diphosphate reductase subunit beta [Mucispirillum sp.]
FLEGIKFPFSFLVTFVINNSYNDAITGFTKTIKLIAHDELSVHVPCGRNIMTILRNNEDEGFKHLFDNGFFNKEAVKMSERVVNQEIKWAEYLFKDRNVAGINRSLSENFIKYWASVRLRDIGIEDNPYSKAEKSDIVDWFNNYRNINKQNAALQETSNTSYQKGILKNDL